MTPSRGEGARRRSERSGAKQREASAGRRNRGGRRDEELTLVRAESLTPKTVGGQSGFYPLSGLDGIRGKFRCTGTRMTNDS